MITLLTCKRIFNIIRDIYFTYFYLNTIDEPKKKNTTYAIVFLFFTLLMFNAEDGGIFNNSIVRIIFRTLCSVAYILLTRKINTNKAFYFSLLNTVIITITHNIFLSPLTRPILLGNYSFVENYLLNNFICLTIVTVLTALIYYITYKILPLRHITDINYIKIIMFTLIATSSIYLNSSLRHLTDNMSIDLSEFSIFSILLQITLLVCLILIELYSYILIENYEKGIQIKTAEGILDSIEKDKINENKIRALRHDLKNHLITIRYYVENKQDDEAIHYIDTLTEQYTSHNVHIETGNRLLDGIFEQKMNYAISKHIETNVSVDFRKLVFIDDVDLCIIFANLLDNAIEACQKVKEHPYLQVRSKEVNNQIIITIKNSYDGVINENMKSTKKDSKNHGIGLKQVNKSLGKYNGTLVSSHKLDEFISVIQLPIH